MFEETYRKEINRFMSLEDVSFQSALDTLEAEYKRLNWDDNKFTILLNEWELK